MLWLWQRRRRIFPYQIVTPLKTFKICSLSIICLMNVGACFYSRALCLRFLLNKNSPSSTTRQFLAVDHVVVSSEVSYLCVKTSPVTNNYNCGERQCDFRHRGRTAGKRRQSAVINPSQPTHLQLTLIPKWTHKELPRREGGIHLLLSLLSVVLITSGVLKNSPLLL